MKKNIKVLLMLVAILSLMAAGYFMKDSLWAVIPAISGGYLVGAHWK